MQLQDVTSDRLNLIQRIWYSIFPGTLDDRIDRRQYRPLFKGLLLHFRPRTVPERTLKFTLTWGLGGMAVILAAMLYDPVKAVRIEAARRMTEIPKPQLDSNQRKRYQSVLLEYQEAMEYSADFAFARYNLGNLYANLEQPEKAIEYYRAAFRIDNQFYPARVNLAMLLNKLGRKDETEVLLREVVNVHPELYEVQYSLGLLLAEKKMYDEAAGHLEIASQGLPGRARIHYNLGLLLQHLKRDPEAEAALLGALEIEPDNLDYLYAAADHYLKRGKLGKARNIAEQMIEKHPDNAIGRDILNFINKALAEKNEP